MKYQNLSSFQKHLSSAAPDHLCRLYLVLIQDDFERTKALGGVLSYIDAAPNRFNGAESNLLDCMDAMQNMSLFGASLVIIDEVEKFSKKEIQTLAEHLVGASGFVLIGSRSKTALLSNVVEKEGVVLDLLDEKPWDKEKRLALELSNRGKNAGKYLSPDAAPLLFERLGIDPALLESEMDKLICYVGERAQISREDILAISPASKTASIWQMAEEVIWEGGAFPTLDSSGFHGMIPALRSQLHIGLSLATLIEEKRPSEDWGRFLPKLWPKTLDKRSSQAARLGSSYFRKGLEKLFEMELISRSSSTQYSALLDLFRAHIHAR